MTAAFSSHGVLVASTVSTVTFSLNYAQIEIVNRDASADIFFTTSGVAPTVGGDDTLVVPAGHSTIVPNYLGPNDPADSVINGTVVKLISAGTPAYSVSGRAGVRS